MNEAGVLFILGLILGVLVKTLWPKAQGPCTHIDERGRYHGATRRHSAGTVDSILQAEDYHYDMVCEKCGTVLFCATSRC